MSTSKRQRPIAVIDQLVREPYRFELFQAIRLLESWWVHNEKISSNEAINKRMMFRNTLRMSFPPSQIEKLEAIPYSVGADSDGGSAVGAGVLATILEACEDGQVLDASQIQRIEITPAAIGLLGVSGALPIFYTELLARHEVQFRDAAARSFLDIFLHRTVVLFYQSWKKHRLGLRYEADKADKTLPLLLSVAGIGQKSLRKRLKAKEGGVSDDTLAFFASTFQKRNVPAPVIRQVLSHYFRVPLKLEQFIGRWFNLPPSSQTRLGIANVGLGESAMVGARTWQRDLRVRLSIGPMGHEQYQRFLPGGTAAMALRELLTLMTGVSLEYEVRLILRPEDVQSVSLGAGPPTRLGWDAYLITQPASQPRSDAGYVLHAA